MNHGSSYFVVTLLLLVLGWGSAHGDQVRIRSGIAIDPSLTIPEVRVRSVNDGPIDVYELKVVMETPWKTSETLVRPVWPVNEETRVLFTAFTVRPTSATKGRFPVIVALMFRDRTGIPITVFETSTFSMGHDGQPDIRLVCRGVRMDLASDLDVEMVNTASADVTVRCRLVYPPSVSVEHDTVDVRLEASSSSSTVFHIRNRYAGLGNVIPVHVVAEYQKGGIHDTVLAKTEITVVSYRETHRWVRGLLWFLLVLSGVAAVYFFYHQTP